MGYGAAQGQPSPAVAVFGQFSDSTSQKPGTTNPTVVAFNTDNENEGIGHARPEDFLTGEGVFAFLFQPQVERTAGGASMDFHAWMRKGRRDGTVSAVAVSNPAVITAPNHRIQTGQMVTLSGLATTPDINGAHVATSTGPNTFTIPVNVTAVTDGVGSWTRQLDVLDDAANSNIELTLQTQDQSDVIPLGMVTRMLADDVVQFIQSVTNSGVGGGLVALTPAGEPAIPSIIATIIKHQG